MEERLRVQYVEEGLRVQYVEEGPCTATGPMCYCYCYWAHVLQLLGACACATVLACSHHPVQLSSSSHGPEGYSAKHGTNCGKQAGTVCVGGQTWHQLRQAGALGTETYCVVACACMHARACVVACACMHA